MTPGFEWANKLREKYIFLAFIVVHCCSRFLDSYGLVRYLQKQDARYKQFDTRVVPAGGHTPIAQILRCYVTYKVGH